MRRKSKKIFIEFIATYAVMFAMWYILKDHGMEINLMSSSIVLAAVYLLKGALS